MSKAISNLRKMEKRLWSEWWASVRYVGECRNAHSTADVRDVKERKAILVMAIANADRAYNTYLQVCEALDEIEAGNSRPHDGQ